jgi:hypothetical protein
VPGILPHVIASKIVDLLKPVACAAGARLYAAVIIQTLAMRVTVLDVAPQQLPKRSKAEELFRRTGLNESAEVFRYRQVRLDTASGLK